jgi:hypothetical protein
MSILQQECLLTIEQIDEAIRKAKAKAEGDNNANG